MGPLRWLDWYGDGSLYMVDLALACCALEVEAAGWRRRVTTGTDEAGPHDLQARVRGTVGGARLAPGDRVGETIDDAPLLPDDLARGVAAEAPPALGDRAQIVVVVSGTVTDRLVPAVLGLIDGVTRVSGRVPTVVSFGACASSGGPYWDSYAVTKGVDEVVPVDVYVPGCPPPPEVLAEVLDAIANRRLVT
jgi:NADH-quinone oxidoreductase subunit B